MAADENVQAQDMKVHQATYLKVIGVLKWGAVACGIIALAVILIISRK